MPEGDTVYRAAKHLHEALAGAELTRCDVRVPRYALVDLTGETVHEVVSRGKHLLHRIGDWSLHTHLKMEGTWQLYRPGTPWRRPAHQARVVLETADWQAVGFSLGITEVVATAQEDEVVGHLGPDLLGPDWDAAEAGRRLAEHPETPVFVAVLDQRNLAGVGNVFANELCFLRGVHPTTPMGDVPVTPAVDLAYRMLHANRDRTTRSTTGELAAGRRTWVYGRAGKPCRRCGTRIRHGQLGPTELQERDCFWCPHCQPEPGTT
jgi:endonuclease VIII